MTYRFKYAAHCREKNSFRLEIHWKFLEIHWKIISHFVERFILVRHLDVKQSNWRLHKCFHAIHKCFWIQNSCNFIALHFFPFIYITDPSLLCHVSSTGRCVCMLKTLCPTRNSLCQSLCAIFVIILKQSSRKKQKKAEMKNKLSVAEEKKRRSFEIQLSIKVYHFHFRCILFWSSFSYLLEYWIYLRVSVFIVLFVFLLYRAPKFSLHWDLFSAIFIHLFIYLPENCEPWTLTLRRYYSIHNDIFTLSNAIASNWMFSQRCEVVAIFSNSAPPLLLPEIETAIADVHGYLLKSLQKTQCNNHIEFKIHFGEIHKRMHLCEKKQFSW